MRINHNIPALRSHHSLERTNNKLDKALQRLSTGLRINRAADDAAGLAIANKMQTQVRGLKVASRNSLDGVSLVQTAEGALNEVQAMLQRMRELSIQAANGTLASEDRQAIQNEVDQLKEEITKTADLTEFNKIKLLNGEIDRRSFSNKADVAEVVFVSDTVQPGDYKFKVGKLGSKAQLIGEETDFFNNSDSEIKVSGRININGEEVEVQETDKPEEVFTKIRELCERVDIEIIRKEVKGDDTTKLTLETKESGKEASIIINDETGLLSEMGLKIKTVGQPITGEDAEIELIRKDSNSEEGFSTTATYYARGNRVEITDKNNQKIYVDVMAGFSVKDGFFVDDKGEKYKYKDKDTIFINAQGQLIDQDGNLVDQDGKQLTGGSITPVYASFDDITITISKAGPLQLHVGPNEDMQVEIQIQSLTAEALGLDRINMRTAAGAEKAIGILDDAINEISALRSKLGAYQNRLEHTINNLDVTAENTTSALSRIEDTDMALEMSEFTQKSILSQAGVSMLAQANQRPQMILQLLQG